MTSPTIAALVKAATLSNKPFNPFFLGFCKSYDWQENQENMRRIRVNYPEGDQIITSPLLLRVVDHAGDDPPMPPVDTVLLCLWLNEEKTQGLWLGCIVNRSQQPPRHAGAIGVKDSLYHSDANLIIESPGNQINMAKTGFMEFRSDKIYFQSGNKRATFEELFDAAGLAPVETGNDFDLDD